MLMVGANHFVIREHTYEYYDGVTTSPRSQPDQEVWAWFDEPGVMSCSPQFILLNHAIEQEPAHWSRVIIDHERVIERFNDPSMIEKMPERSYIANYHPGTQCWMIDTHHRLSVDTPDIKIDKQYMSLFACIMTSDQARQL